MESFEKKLTRVLAETIAVVPYNDRWPVMFEQEKEHLLQCLPTRLITKIEHFGSTAVPGLWAKPIIDMLVEVTSLEDTIKKIVPVLEGQGYDYFWRPSFGDDVPPFYAWFIKRDTTGNRTHHIHMVEHDFDHGERLLFRDYLREHPHMAKEYQDLKLQLSKRYAHDRVIYTEKKTDFIVTVIHLATKESHGNSYEER